VVEIVTAYAVSIFISPHAAVSRHNICLEAVRLAVGRGPPSGDTPFYSLCNATVLLRFIPLLLKLRAWCPECKLHDRTYRYYLMPSYKAWIPK
jgi:hypothetical protein